MNKKFDFSDFRAAMKGTEEQQPSVKATKDAGRAYSVSQLSRAVENPSSDNGKSLMVSRAVENPSSDNGKSFLL